jgi:protein-tyrosine phosphatase
MIDLHSHLLPGLDDGAPDLATAKKMAEAFVADGVTVVACTPHILPGIYQNTGPHIRQAVAQLQDHLDEAGIALRLVPGADNHITPDFVRGLRTGHLLSLNDSRYVLVEPPHHVAPARLEDLFFSITMAGYVPVLTHPERLTWIRNQYAMMARLAQSGVWMQATAGSLSGAFGRDAQYWAERMLDEGLVSILATDAHDLRRRAPDLARGRDEAAKRIGDIEARHLVETRPRGIIANVAPDELPVPAGGPRGDKQDSGSTRQLGRGVRHSSDGNTFAGRLRRLFE